MGLAAHTDPPSQSVAVYHFPLSSSSEVYYYGILFVQLDCQVDFKTSFPNVNPLCPLAESLETVSVSVFF